MNKLETINGFINALKIIIGLGVIARVIFCLIKMMYDEEGKSFYKRKIINIVIFGIIAELCLVIKDVIMFYYN